MKKYLRLLSLLALIFTLVLLPMRPLYSEAMLLRADFGDFAGDSDFGDSGWDSGWDSDSDSGWDNDSDWSSSSSGGSSWSHSRAGYRLGSFNMYLLQGTTNCNKSSHPDLSGFHLLLKYQSLY